MTVVPVNGGNLIKDTVFYALIDPKTGLAPTNDSIFLDSDPTFPFKIFDVRVDQATDTSGRPEMFLFDVSSDKTSFTTTTNQILVLTVSTGPAAGSAGAKNVPITSVNGADCTSGVCHTAGVSLSGHYFATSFAKGTTVRVGFYPRDVCNDYLAQAQTTAAGCATDPSVTSQQTVVPGAAPATLPIMPLTFAINVLPSSSEAPTGTAQDSGVLNMRFQIDAPKLNCPNLAGQQIYIPGDRAITLDSSGFGMGTDLGSFVVDRAPATTLLVVGNDGKDPDVSSSFATGNAILSRTPIGSSAIVGGLTNTTDQSDHKFQFSFLIRDATGLLAAPSDLPACTLKDVQTSTIQGFLQKSSCFIATAAFNSADASPVTMLREFRGKVLLGSAWGRAFVRTYYRWSPPAAQWLLAHPAVRIPVLFWLIPVELLAWITLSPGVFIVLFLSGVFLVLFSLAFYLRKRFTPLFLLALAAILLGSLLPLTSPAQEKTTQPYIDELKKGMEEKETSSKPYTDLQKEKLPPNLIKLGAYIDELKKEAPESSKEGSTPTHGTFLEREQEKIREKDAENDEKKLGAIEAFKQGKSDLEAKKIGQILHATGFRIGVSSTRNITAPAGTGLRNFSDVYGTSWTPEISLFFEYQPFHSEWFGSFGLWYGFGVSYYHGYGSFEFPLRDANTNTDFNIKSSTLLQFYAIPVTAGLSYRLNFLRLIRPYVMVAPTLIGYLETRNDDQSGYRGVSKGLFFNGGAAILLDWMSRSMDYDRNAALGIHHTYITVDYTRISTLASTVSFSVSSLSVGLTFEY
ncbi:CFI-box-CTERM domain-containing protein [Bdellovibrionota bacterium FG-2]